MFSQVRRWMVMLMLGVYGVASAQTADLFANHALWQALKDGNAAEVQRIAKTEHVGPLLMDAFNAQLDYDLPRLHAASKACRDSAYKAHALELARYCAELAYSSAIQMGDARKAFRVLARAARTGLLARKGPIGNL